MAVMDDEASWTQSLTEERSLTGERAAAQPRKDVCNQTSVVYSVPRSVSCRSSQACHRPCRLLRCLSSKRDPMMPIS